MSRDDLEQHIQDVIDRKKKPPGPPGRLSCLQCGKMYDHGEGIKWDVPAPPGGEGGTNHYCTEECMEQHKQDIIEGNI